MPDSLQKKISIYVNHMALGIALINLTVGYACGIVTNNLKLLIPVSIEIMTVLSVIWLNHKKKHKAAALVLYIIISIATFYFCCVLGKLAETQVMLVFLIGAAMFIFQDERTRIICVILAFLNLGIVQLNDTYLFLKPVQATAGARQFVKWSTFAVVSYLVYSIFKWYWRITDGLRKQVEANLELKEKFISNSTHEMRVTFKSIFSILTTLIKMEDRRPSADKAMKLGLQDLKAAFSYARSNIENVFEYNRRKAGLETELDFQLMNVETALKGLVEINRYVAAEKQVMINLVVAEHIPHEIICDDMKFRQIVTNILHNAIKFTRNRTTVTVALTQLGSQLLLSIMDEGNGISDAIAPRIFDPFYTQNPDGLGLGLYIVSELVHTIGGDIEVIAKNPAGGATFNVTIPIREPSALSA